MSRQTLPRQRTPECGEDDQHELHFYESAVNHVYTFETCEGTNPKIGAVMSIETTEWFRKPFPVRAVQVDADNMALVAEWCAGAIETVDNEQEGVNTYIKVDTRRPLTVRQTRAYLGDWVLQAGTGFKVYTDKAFKKSFEPSSAATVMQPTADNEVPPATPDVRSKLPRQDPTRTDGIQPSTPEVPSVQLFEEDAREVRFQS